MEAERRALYTSLRMNWQLDPSLAVEPWQVEDYRSLPLDKIFERLRLQDVHLDKNTFIQFADSFESPEELSEHLLDDADVDYATHDQIYLLVFELWRRLLPEKPCLTIFCDELDHQINNYDSGKTIDLEAIQDVLAQLQVVLDENTDQGIDPVVAFETISVGCANDLESFLYDFIAEQMEADNDSYASELLDDFAPYVKEVKWFDFLRARIQAENDPFASDILLHQLIEEAEAEPELEFNLEMLAFLVAAGDHSDFVALVHKSVPLLLTEEDFQDLLSVCADFYHRLDREQGEAFIQEILKKRSKIALYKPFDPSDPDVTHLFQALID